MAIAPLSRTPMDKESARSLSKYQREVLSDIADMTPWRKKRTRRDELLRSGMVPGEVVVVLDADDNPNNPLFAGLRVKNKR